MSPANIIIVYDGDCMMCRQFRAFVELEKKTTLTRYDMHISSEIVDIYRSRGYDIDQGMIIDIDGVIYHGAMALTILETLVAVPYWWQRVLLSGVRSPWIAKMIYPVLLLIRAVFKSIY